MDNKALEKGNDHVNEAYRNIRKAISELESYDHDFGSTRETALARTKAQESMMWLEAHYRVANG